MSVIIFQTQSVLIVSLMILGVYQVKKANRNLALHQKIMKFSMLWDVILILQIELSRGAVAKASKVMSNSYLLNIHVALAISTVLLYVFVYRTGKKLASGQKQHFKKHKLLGAITLTTRIATLITSFYIL